MAGRPRRSTWLHCLRDDEFPVHAQERVARSFEQLQVLVEPGDTISIEAAGSEIAAEIASLTSTELTVVVAGERRTFAPRDVNRIRQRRGDSLANGAWWGFGIGVGFGVLGAALTVALDEGSEDLGFPAASAVVAVYGAMGAGLGVGIDALIRRRQVIYESASATSGAVLMPLVGHKRAGAVIAFRFGSASDRR